MESALLGNGAATSRKRPLRDKVIIITGAAAGVGRAAAIRFASAGARLGLISRDRRALEALREDALAAGASAVAVAALDVSDAQAVKHAASRFEGELGPIEIWINDAMLTVFSPFREITPDEFRRVTEVTYLGVVYGCMAALGCMRQRRRGQIVNVGSALAYRGIPLQSAYCGAKHAIRGFTASLRTELRHERSGIGVSIVELPAMNTPQFDWARTHMPRQPKPMGTIYQPEAAAEAIFRAAQTGVREYWVGWSTLLTIVGNMIAPDFMDRYLARNAVAGQETSQAVQAARKDNLFDPVTELHRTRGSFGATAHPHAAILPAGLTRAGIVGTGALCFSFLGLAAMALLRRSPRFPAERSGGRELLRP
jgi:NAD(P)-dependent dehydrogenase (short-subunit alcohol dehydrogenase family)